MTDDLTVISSNSDMIAFHVRSVVAADLDDLEVSTVVDLKGFRLKKFFLLSITSVWFFPFACSVSADLPLVESSIVLWHTEQRA